MNHYESIHKHLHAFTFPIFACKGFCGCCPAALELLGLGFLMDPYGPLWFSWFQEALELFRSLQLPLLETTALLLESGAYLGAQDFDRSQKLGCISRCMALRASSGAGVDDDGGELTCRKPLHKRLHI